MGVQIGLDGKVAVITGGSRGIGEAIARTFVARGARVMIASRKLDGVASVAASIAKEHGEDRVRAVMCAGHQRVDFGVTDLVRGINVRGHADATKSSGMDSQVGRCRYS